MYNLLNGKQIYEKEEIDSRLIPVEEHASEAITKASEVFDLATSAKAIAEEAKADVSTATKAAMDAEAAVNGVRDTTAKALNTAMTAVNIANDATKIAKDAKKIAEEALLNGGSSTLGLNWQYAFTAPETDWEGHGGYIYAGTNVFDDIIFCTLVASSPDDAGTTYKTITYYTTDNFLSINKCNGLSEVGSIFYTKASILKFNDKYTAPRLDGIYQSTDGINWTKVYDLPNTYANLHVIDDKLYFNTVTYDADTMEIVITLYSADTTFGVTPCGSVTYTGENIINAFVVNECIYYWTLIKGENEYDMIPRLLRYNKQDNSFIKVQDTRINAYLDMLKDMFSTDLILCTGKREDIFTYNDVLKKYIFNIHKMVFLSDDGVTWTQAYPYDEIFESNSSADFFAGPYILNGIETYVWSAFNNSQSGLACGIMQIIDGQPVRKWSGTFSEGDPLPIYVQPPFVLNDKLYTLSYDSTNNRWGVCEIRSGDIRSVTYYESGSLDNFDMVKPFTIVDNKAVILPKEVAGNILAIATTNNIYDLPHAIVNLPANDMGEYDDVQPYFYAIHKVNGTMYIADHLYRCFISRG